MNLGFVMIKLLQLITLFEFAICQAHILPALR